MITGFEDYTAPLTDKDKEIVVPAVKELLDGRVGQSNAITNKAIREMLNSRKGVLVPDVKIRAIINYIRKNQVVKHLLACSKGYYIATSVSEVENYCRSLGARSNEILEVKKALQDGLTSSLFL